MNLGNRKIDHLVYCVPNLEAAIQNIYIQTGIKAVIGGQHLLKGTKNAIINLGHKCYLEILAADDTTVEIQKPRWMGIDLINKPMLTRWSIKSTNLETDLNSVKNYFTETVLVVNGERKLPSGGTLKWRLQEPLAHPKVDLIPFLIDWSESQNHPTDNLKHEKAQLESLKFFHTDPELIRSVFDVLFKDLEIEKADQIRISATISGPTGSLTL